MLAGALLASVLLPVRGAPASALTLPSGFQEQVVFTGLSSPTNIEFSPDGRIFVAEKGGAIKVFDNLADTTPTLFADFSAKVHNQADRGMLGLALSPNFPTDPWVYVLYAYDAPPGQTAPYWNDTCSSVGGDNAGRCVATARLSKLQAAGNVMTGTEQVLLHDWCQQYPSHSIGDLHFGADGALYVTSGDGASFNVVDYGQTGSPPNPCADPTNEGGALRSQDLLGPADATGLNGSVLRLNPVTGEAMAGNPLIGSADLNTRRIVAEGLRNPYRFAIRPGTSEVWVGDVGWNAWEEINRVNTLTSPVTNFGWPCYEGFNKMDSYDNANLALCENFYLNAYNPAVTHSSPYFTYNHSSKVVAGETCPTGGSSISGAAFYPASGGPYPAEYGGALFFADYSRKCIWAMRPTAPGGLPATSNIVTFAADAANPVDLEVGPGGDLYYVDLAGTIRRIRYFPGNQPPVAVIGVTASAGDAPLTVGFNGAGSSDADPADQGRLTYKWDFTNDGTVDSTVVAPSFTYAAGVYTAKLTVTDTLGATNATTVTIQSGNGAPNPIIDTPTAGTTWAVGDTISFTGHGTDPQEGTLPASALTWELDLHHCYAADNCHLHPQQSWTGVAGGSFVAPDHEYPSYLELKLTATDAGGLSTTVTRRLDPKTVDLTYQTNPPGLQLSVGSATQVTPFTRTVVQGSSNSVSAPTPQVVGDTSYAFTSWSDSGAQTHVITAPTTAATYTASYTGTALPPSTFGYNVIGAAVDTGDMNYMNGSRFVSGTSAMTVSSLNVYMKTVKAAPANQYQLAIYTDNSGSPGTLVASSTSGTLTANSWNSRPVTATLAANTAYWLMYNTNGDNNLAYDLGTANQGSWSTSATTFGTWPTAFGTSVKTSFKFSLYATVTSGPDTTAPTVQSSTPANGAIGVSTTAPISVNFTEPMAAASISTGTVELRTSGGTLVNRTVAYDAATASAVITPNAALSTSTAYTVTVKGGAGGVTDVAGNALAADHQFSFTTANPTATVFGYNVIGGSTDTGDMNYMNGSRFVVGASPLTVSSLNVYMKTVKAAPANQYQLAIYSDNSGSPGTLVASSTSGTLTANSWNSRPVTATLAANTAYWLMYNTNGDNNLAYDLGTANQGSWSTSATTFGTWPATFGASVKTSFKFSLYAQ